MEKYFNKIKPFILKTYAYFLFGIFIAFSLYIVFFMYSSISNIYQVDELTINNAKKSLFNSSLFEDIVKKKEAKQSPNIINNVNSPFNR